MKDKIYDGLQDVFRTVFLNPPIQIAPHTTAADIRGWDSLTHMALIAAVEKHFQVEFSFAEASNFSTVGDMASAIERKLLK